MCEPISIGLGIGAASMAANLYSQQQAANAQNDYRQRLSIANNANYQANANSVIRYIGYQIDALSQRDVQNSNATRAELENAFRGARESKSTYSTQAAGAGVEGRSVQYLHEQFTRDVSDFESAAARNISNFRSQSSMEAKAIYARGQSAINGGYPAPLPPTATVSWATSIMNGVSTGLAAYGTVHSAMSTPAVGSSQLSAGNAIDGARVPNYVSANPTANTSFGSGYSAPAPALNYFNAASYFPRG